MDFADADLLAEFAVESLEGLSNIEQQMLAIETAGANVDVDLVNAVFRTMHSIKGAAGFLGLDRIGTLAHRLEEVLNYLRNREILPSSQLVSAVLHSADCMKELLDSLDTSNEADISQYIDQLQGFRPASATVPTSAGPASTTTPTETAAPTERPTATAATNELLREFIAECQENLDSLERDLLALERGADDDAPIHAAFRSMHTIKGGAGLLGLNRLERLAHSAESVLGRVRDGRVRCSGEVAAALVESIDQCRLAVELVARDGVDAAFDPGPLVARLEQNAVAPPTGATKTPAPQVVPAPAREPSQERSAPAPSAESTLRVDVALLDKLMTRVGELVLARNQLLQRISSSADPEVAATAQRLNLITSELQEGVMKTRMQPIGNVWSKFPRVVRDLSAQLGKQVRIEMEGAGTELDKTILEAIKDPLTHLVRNSVDHGIEAPATRVAVGKPAEGCLLLRAFHEGGQVNIEIADDGAGLPLDRIRKKAVERGLLTAEQSARLSDSEAAQLIFAPGFSTAEKVTNVSGRGVGMDVVKTNIERIGGTIDLQARPGQGTTLRIKIPLTLAIVPALIVGNDGERYAIPQASLLELVRLKGEEIRRIEHVHGAPVFRLRGKLLPLVDLSARLGGQPLLAAANSSPLIKAINIVVLRVDDRQFGLLVERVMDTEEIVVKPLGALLDGVVAYAGATILGDGTVALILDGKALAPAASSTAEAARREASTAGNHAEAAADEQTMLVAEVAPHRRIALPTSLVARLEKIDERAVEFAQGREVVQYRGTLLPLVRLAQTLGEQPASQPGGKLNVIVYEQADYRCGFVVQRIIDTAEVDFRAMQGANTTDCLLGTSVIHGRVTDVLDLHAAAQSQRALGSTGGSW